MATNFSPVKVWFTDFYKGFDPYHNMLLDILKPHVRLIVEPENPEFLIYSCHGQEFLQFDIPRICYLGENLVPDFNLCDFAIGFHHLQFRDRYLRYPNYAFFVDQVEQLLERKRYTSSILSEKQYFCNFIYANANAHPARDSFFNLLNQYKQVSAPGKHLNNAKFDIGDRFSEDWMYSKLDFQRSCKFSIAFENSSSPGYVTEKIVHAFLSHTIPIYWGDPEVASEFNSKAFINCHEFKTFEEVVARVAELDQDDQQYLDILNQPPYPNNQLPDHLQLDKLINFLRAVFSLPQDQRIRRPKHGTTRNYEMERRPGKTELSPWDFLKSLRGK